MMETKDEKNRPALAPSRHAEDDDHNFTSPRRPSQERQKEGYYPAKKGDLVNPNGRLQLAPSVHSANGNRNTNNNGDNKSNEPTNTFGRDKSRPAAGVVAEKEEAFVVVAEIVRNTEVFERENEALRREKEELEAQNQELVSRQREVIRAEIISVSPEDERKKTTTAATETTCGCKLWLMIVIALLVVGGVATGVAISVSRNNENDDVGTDNASSNMLTTVPVSGTMMTTSQSPSTTAPPTLPVLWYRSASDPNKCLTLPKDNFESFDELYLDDCGLWGIRQEFVLDEFGFFRVQSATSFCVEGDSNLNGGGDNLVFVYTPCIDEWTYTADCTLQNDGEGRCMSVENDGVTLSVQPCDPSSPQQRWRSSAFPGCDE